MQVDFPSESVERIFYQCGTCVYKTVLAQKAPRTFLNVLSKRGQI